MFQLANPWALLLLPLPLLLWYCLPKYKQLPLTLKVPFFESMLALKQQEKTFTYFQSSLLIPALIWIALSLALARPIWVSDPLPVERTGYNIMMALDLSASMEVPDMVLHGQPASRLAVVKKAAREFITARKSDKIGLILFGTRAYLQTPLTYDKHNVLMRVEDATAGLAGNTTSLGDALGLAVKSLESVPPKGRIIILLTDGANNSGVLAPLKAAELAQQDGIKVYTIGLGSEADPRALSQDFFNNATSADLDEKTLQSIAQLTGGRYFRATDTSSLEAIYKTIHQLETVTQDQASLRAQKEYYPWFAAIALLLGISWLIRFAALFKPKPSYSETNHVD